MELRKKIMIIDDDEGILEALSILLRNAGFEVLTQPDGKAILSEKFILPDLFLLDNKLSGIDGIEVCRFLKGNEGTKNIPVIFFSASPDIEEKTMLAGADDFVAKPFSMKFLVEKINYQINKAMGLTNASELS